MLEVELSRKMMVSLDDVYKLSAEYHRLFDAFDAILEEQKSETQDIIDGLHHRIEDYESEDSSFEVEINALELTLDALESENEYLKDLLTENGIDYSEECE